MTNTTPQKQVTIGQKWDIKYRPKTFKDFVGIDNTLVAIESYILKGDFPHLVFHGEKGTGKTALAEVIATKLLGEDSNNFIERNASDERGEEQVRKLIKSLRCMPLFSNIRVVLWDEFNLKPTAQELIKRPMEKLKNTIFIITTNDIGLISEPIKSRCTLFEFKKLPDDAIIKGLKIIAEKEHLKLDDNTFKEIAKKADGDMRSATGELQKQSALHDRNEEIDRIVNEYIAKQAQGVKA